MADKKDDDKGTGTGDGGGGEGADKSTVRGMVAEVLGELFKSGKADVAEKDGAGAGGGGRGRHDDAGVQDQVEKAVRRVQEKDARDRAERERDDRLKALEEKVKTPEKAPTVVRRATRFMWGGEDD